MTTETTRLLFRFLCKNAYLRANVRVVIGSIALTLAGAALLVFGVLVMTIPNEIGRWLTESSKGFCGPKACK